MNVDLSGLDRLVARFRKIANPDATDLMLSFMTIIEADNRKGVLAGTDRHGSYMLAVTYRPKPPPAYYKKILGFDPSKLSARQRNTAGRKRTFGGIGPQASGLHNNLTSSEYRYLTGPPLAPRGQYSRVITNLKTGYIQPRPIGDGMRWEALGAWDEVVNTKGQHFLAYHFTGAGRLPTRDLRGVRPEGMEKAKRAAVAWMRDRIRFAGVEATYNRTYV